MKTGIFQDIHANLPALRKSLEIFEHHKCDKIFHVGDLIGIGPHPKEVVDLAISTPKLEFIMGNHDYWYAFGIPTPRPEFMSAAELEHQLWTHAQIGEGHGSTVRKWKFVEDFRIDHETAVSFVHYGYDERENWFKDFVKAPDPRSMDQLFDGISAKMIFYGHNHDPSDITGKARYVNLGSAGCHTKPEVRLGILKVKEGELYLDKLAVPYDDDGLMEDFERKKVPARAFITSNFIIRK